MASMPSIPGIRTSMNTTSGESSRARSTASSPLDGLSHDHDVVGQLERRAQTLPRHRVVIDDQGADLRHGDLVLLPSQAK